MFSFLSMYGMHQNGCFDEVMKKENLTLEDILDEDTVLNEIKSVSSKVHTFLDHREIKKLIDYIIIEPTDPNDKKRSYRYPYYSSELLSAESYTIINAFFEANKCGTSSIDDEDQLEPRSPGDGEEEIEKKLRKPSRGEREEEEVDLLVYLFSFLEGKNLNPVLCGYFTKVVTMLLNRRTDQVVEFLLGSPRYLELIINEIQSRSLAELLLKVLIVDMPQTLTVEKKIHVIEELLRQKFDASRDFEELANVSYIVTELIEKSQDMVSGIVHSPLLIEILCKAATTENADLVQHAAKILISLHNAWRNLAAQLKDGEISREDLDIARQSAEKNETPLHIEMIKSVPAICERIASQTQEAQYMTTTYGVSTKKLGCEKLKLIELLKQVILLEENNLNEAIANSKFFPICFSLLEACEWNNMLHNQVEQIIKIVLEGNSIQLNESLVNKAGLLDVIIRCIKEEEFTLPTGPQRRIRKGFLGHSTRLANLISKVAERNAILHQAITENPNWSTVVSVYLDRANRRDNFDLGGVKKLSMEENDLVQRITDDYASLQQTLAGITLASTSGNKHDEEEPAQEEAEDVEEDDHPEENGKHTLVVGHWEESHQVKKEEAKRPSYSDIDVAMHPEDQDMQNEYIDSVFWKVDLAVNAAELEYY